MMTFITRAFTLLMKLASIYYFARFRDIWLGAAADAPLPGRMLGQVFHDAREL